MSKSGPGIAVTLLTATATMIAGLVGSTLSVAGRSSKTRERPHILVLLADDLGWGQTGFQGGAIATPNIDSLAREGVNLTQFYVQPACTPTRACFLTGRYPFRTGTVRRFKAKETAGMLLDERTLAEALGQAGYRTAMVGKWHLGAWKKAHLPLQRGFDHQYGLYGSGIDYFQRTRQASYDWHRNEHPINEEGYSTDLIADEAVRLLAEHDPSTPLFLYVAFNAPHRPHARQAPHALLMRHARREINATLIGQAAQVEAMDMAIGRILEALDAAGLRHSTLVIFFNDNGAPEFIGNGPYRGGKLSYHEGGVRVAALMRWPGTLHAGTEIDAPLHVVDLYPTLVKLAGGALRQKLPLDGVDAWKTIAAGKKSPRREIVFGRHAIRRDEWKYIDGEAEYYDWKAEESQLYNIAEDPYEQKNLVSDLPRLVKKLRARLERYGDAARPPEEHSPIAGDLVVFGEEENAGDKPAWLIERVEAARKRSDREPAEGEEE